LKARLALQLRLNIVNEQAIEKSDNDFGLIFAFLDPSFTLNSLSFSLSFIALIVFHALPNLATFSSVNAREKCFDSPLNRKTHQRNNDLIRRSFEVQSSRTDGKVNYVFRLGCRAGLILAVGLVVEDEIHALKKQLDLDECLPCVRTDVRHDAPCTDAFADFRYE
jgi:hypothetical protein